MEQHDDQAREQRDEEMQQEQQARERVQEAERPSDLDPKDKADEVKGGGFRGKF